MQTLDSLITEMFVSGSSIALADYLETEKHSEASEIRFLENPLQVLRRLAQHLSKPAVIFSLPISQQEQLEVALLHTRLDDSLLFTIACDFANHVLPVFEAWNENDKRLENLIETMRDWINHNCKDDQLREARYELTNYSSRRKISKMPAGPKDVVSTVLTATDPWAWAKHCAAAFSAHETSVKAQKIAGPTEIDWQIEHATQMFLKNGNSNGP